MVLPLQPVSDRVTNQNFQEIAKQFPLGDQHIADSVLALFLRLISAGTANFGSTSVTFTASAFSGTVEVNHGLGKKPTLILLTAEKSGGTFVYPNYLEVNETRFKVQATVNGGTLSTSVPVSWLAIG